MNKEEYEGLKRYLKLEILDNCKVINDQEKDEIEYLTKFDSVKDLVEAHKKLDEGLMTEDEFNKLHDKYRYLVAHPEEDEGFDEEDYALISNETPTYPKSNISRESLDELVSEIKGEGKKLSKEYEELAEYFKLDLQRDIFPSEKLEEKISIIASNNDMVDKIERARKLLEEGKIAKASYIALVSFYRSECFPFL